MLHLRVSTPSLLSCIRELPRRRGIHSLGALIEQANAAAVSQRPMLVQCGIGETGHPEVSSRGHVQTIRSDATTAAIRACRNALGWNSSPAGRIHHYLTMYGKKELRDLESQMLVHVRLGVPDGHQVDFARLKSEAFPYGRLLPLDVVAGGLSYRANDAATSIAVVAAVAIGFHDPSTDGDVSFMAHDLGFRDHVF